MSGGARWTLVLPALVAAFLGHEAVSRILERTGGVPSAPLDDSFIHFQFARGFATLQPLVYAPGEPPVPGATSWAWPLALAPAWRLGLRGESLLWWAWVLGFASLALLAVETTRLARRLVSEPSALAAGAMVPCFGGYVWGAASGMEVVPFAWLLVLAARRAVEWQESEVGTPRAAGALLALAALLPLARPEGALSSASIAAAFALGPAPPGARRWPWALGALALPVLPALLQWAITGQAGTTTAEVKWLLASPYQEGGRVTRQIGENLLTLFRVLLNGEVWSAIFLPRGSAPVLWLALPALAVAGWHTGARFRAAATLVVALGILVPTTYDSFLWNRLRYLWPFLAGWFVGVAALGEWIARELSRLRPELERVGPLVPAAAAGALLTYVPHTLRDVAESADAIHRQQVALGHWAREHLPEDARIGVNDTGAIAYFSERRTFDVVGLTTRGEARYWAHGAGSRFEHYERLGPDRRPTHFLVYPHWFALPDLLGEWLTERSVPGATILGGDTMEARVADWTLLGSGERPERPPADRELIDSLDVADLESEGEHRYWIGPGSAADNVAIRSGDRLDGARRRRALDRFLLEVAPGAVLVARLGSDTEQVLRLTAAGRSLGELRLVATPWQEVALSIPDDAPRGRVTIELAAEPGQHFDAMHYWAYR